jgi:hypothetical protein
VTQTRSLSLGPFDEIQPITVGILVNKGLTCQIGTSSMSDNVYIRYEMS